MQLTLIVLMCINIFSLQNVKCENCNNLLKPRFQNLGDLHERIYTFCREFGITLSNPVTKDGLVCYRVILPHFSKVEEDTTSILSITGFCKRKTLDYKECANIVDHTRSLCMDMKFSVQILDQVKQPNDFFRNNYRAIIMTYGVARSFQETSLRIGFCAHLVPPVSLYRNILKIFRVILNNLPDELNSYCTCMDVIRLAELKQFLYYQGTHTKQMPDSELISFFKTENLCLSATPRRETFTELQITAIAPNYKSNPNLTEVHLVNAYQNIDTIIDMGWCNTPENCWPFEILHQLINGVTQGGTPDTIKNNIALATEAIALKMNSKQFELYYGAFQDLENADDLRLYMLKFYHREPQDTRGTYQQNIWRDEINTLFVPHIRGIIGVIKNSKKIKTFHELKPELKKLEDLFFVNTLPHYVFDLLLEKGTGANVELTTIYDCLSYLIIADSKIVEVSVIGYQSGKDFWLPRPELMEMLLDHLLKNPAKCKSPPTKVSNANELKEAFRLVLGNEINMDTMLAEGQLAPGSEDVDMYDMSN